MFYRSAILPSPLRGESGPTEISSRLFKVTRTTTPENSIPQRLDLLVHFSPRDVVPHI